MLKKRIHRIFIGTAMAAAIVVIVAITTEGEEVKQVEEVELDACSIAHVAGEQSNGEFLTGREIGKQLAYAG